MNIYIVIFGIFLCFVMVNGRHYMERSDTEGFYDERNEQENTNIKRERDHSASQMRHRRNRRWPANYGYNYGPPPPPPYPYYPDDRRDYDRNQQDLLPQIMRLLDEISTYVKRPTPSPPQPIYVPYPVPYLIPQYCSCKAANNTPNLTSRFPEMEDTNQNWGFTDNDDQADDGDDNDGVRPISFDPIRPKRPSVKTPPAVEHGSNQAAAVEVTTYRPRSSAQGRSTSTSSGTLGSCDAAVLSCCRPSESRQLQRKCFTDLNCAMSFANGNACKPEAVKAVLDKFSRAYSPVN